MRGQTDQPRLEARIARLATRQHGVVARGQLRRLGLSDDQIDRWLGRGALIPLHRGVYAVGHRALAEGGRWMAGVLAGGEGAALSHRCAAAHWEIAPARSPVVEVTVPVRTGRRSHRGALVIHRCRLTPADVTRKLGIPSTRPPRTLIDLAEILPRRGLERAVDEAERLRLCSVDDLLTAVDRHRGRRGAAVLAAVLACHEPGTTITESQLEELFLALCDKHSIPPPQVNVRLGRYRPDFLWAEARLIVETDGRATHGTRRAFERDRRRDVELGSAGYRVLRFTWRQLTHEAHWVAATVLDALARPWSVSPRTSR